MVNDIQDETVAAVFTARCYTERGCEIACRLSVRPSVHLSVRDVEVCFSHQLEFFENKFMAE